MATPLKPSEVWETLWGTNAGSAETDVVFSDMTDDNDGVALTSISHPQPPWYRRPYWAVRVWLTYRCGFRKRSVVTEETE